MNTLKPAKIFLLSGIAISGLVACDVDKAEQKANADVIEIDKTAPSVSFKTSEDDYDGTVTKPGSPYSISYRIIGSPIIGSPLTVDLRVTSTLDPRPMTLDYRINDDSSMMFAESQPRSIRMELADNERAFKQQVTVIPQREGRHYLNLSASFETENGTRSTVTAIPIQVGTGTRELQPHGELQEDENGESVRVLSND
jgi:hypothetical protein